MSVSRTLIYYYRSAKQGLTANRRFLDLEMLLGQPVGVDSTMKYIRTPIPQGRRVLSSVCKIQVSSHRSVLVGL